MSLINQMLRDLEQRQTAQSEQPPVTPVGVSTDSIEPAAQRPLKLCLWGMSICVGVGIAWAKGPDFLDQWLPTSQPPVPTVAAADLPKPTTTLPATLDKAKLPEVGQQSEPASREVAVADQPEAMTPSPRAPSKPKPKSKPTKITAAFENVEVPAPVSTREQPVVAVSKPVEPPVSKQRRMDPATQARLEIAKAQQKLQSGQISAATDALIQAVVLQPNWSEPRVKLVGLYQQQGRWAEADQLLAQAVKLEPRSAYWALMRAKNKWQQEGAPSAIKLLEKARTDNVRDLNLDLFLAALYQRSKQYQDSAVVYQDIISRDQQQGKAWLGLAISLQALQQPRDALAAFQQALRSGGHEPNVQQYIEQRIAALRA